MLRKNWPALAAIACLWLLVNAFLYSKNGVKVVNDSARYIEYAQGLSSGFYFDVHNFWYIGYSLFLAFIFLLGGDVQTVIIIQYLVSLGAVLTLYQASVLLFDSERSAIITCVFFLLFIDIPQWNSYILAESVYTSFICFSIYILVRRWWYLLPVVLFTILIKPTGVALLGAVAIVLISNTLKRRSVIFVLVILFGLLLNRMLATYTVIENYHKGEIIYAVTTLEGRSDLQSLVVQTPTEAYDPPASWPPLIRIIAFIFHHPLYWANLFLHKVFYLMAHVRPFWSVSHNLYSVAALFVTYISFFIGIRNKSISRDVVIFAITFLSIHILSVGITSEDWDGRFLIPMLPVIFIFSGHGLATWRYRKSTQ